MQRPIHRNEQKPVPAFPCETALQKVRGAKVAWDSRDSDRVVQVCTENTVRPNRAEFPVGRGAVRAFLQRQRARERDHRLIKELWAFADHRIAVRFLCAGHDDSGQWFCSYGNQNRAFNAEGTVQQRFASFNDLPI